MRAHIFATCALLIAAPLYAQVGVPPEQSPFRDIENRMEVSFLSGFLHAGKEPVGVAPKSGPYFGARWEMGFGSLVSLTGRAALVASGRTLIDPSLPAGSRVLGEANHMLFLVDAGLGFSLTGGKSFHNLVPGISLGIGLASDLQTPDATGYALGTRFLFSLGGGVKWLVAPNWQVRADVVDNLFAIHYPSNYMEPASDGTRAREGDEKIHTHNVALTLGLSYRFFR